MSKRPAKKNTPKRTQANAARFICNVLDGADQRDDWPDMLQAAAGSGPREINTAGLTTEALVADPRVQKAFRKFCDRVIGSLQFMEEMPDGLE